MKNKYIPFILLVIAMISSCLFMKELSIEAVFEGILCWGASIGINQIQVQNRKEK
ncbi:phage holin family protein [Clostridioides difficile]|uniref:phage holin family protein n=1 Tax=Clostridioides difficile TaxID=1496 RepID=UPI002FE6D046